MIEDLPPAFIHQIKTTFGADGARFLKQLPESLAACASRYNLTILPPFPNLSFNYVAPATMADGTPVVVKLGVPREELNMEIATLEHYGGVGAVRLLAADREQGWQLLEQVQPGTMLSAHPNDEEATVIAATVMQKLWRPPSTQHHYPTINDWFDGLRQLRIEFAGGTGPFAPQLVEEAERLAPELLATAAPGVVLHGDLHHYNILAGQREPWLAIDPQGVIGEPAYEIGALMRNPNATMLQWPNLLDILERRLTILADTLKMDRARLRAWTVAQGVLSAWWDYEPGRSPGDWLSLAETLAKLKE